ncbi:MAG: tetratricopeptide repeat protein [Gemmataceae bacterium]|nr:tetratricopeptide repeat protein [Gemmataceae bacterium]
MIKSDLYAKITALLASGARNEAELLIGTNRAALSEPEYKECLGNLHFYAKNYQKATMLYEAAMESWPEYDCARYHYLLGVQAEQAGQLSNAFERYQAAIGIEPGFVDAYIELGGLLCKVGDFEGAFQCYTDAIGIDPADLAIRHNLLQVLSQLAQKDPATYSQPLKDAQAAYDAAKGSLSQPESARVW